MQKQLDLISRFLHFTTEPFDDWYWDGIELLIVLKRKIIERYSFEDLKSIIEDF